MPIIEPEFMALTEGLDVQAFWEENERCWDLTPAKPRCALLFSPDDHWLFEFMEVPSTLRYYQDKAYRDDLHRMTNAITRQYMGLTFFEEDSWQHQPHRIENLFDCFFTYTEGGTPWLTPATDDPEEFARILDKAEATDVAAWAFPEPFRAEWAARVARGCTLPRLGEGSRGPATIMTSILHAETAIFWMYDHPELMGRFRDILAAKMVELNRALRAFSANTEPGWWITDDNSALLNRELYHEFCYPVLEKVLAEFAPPGARRYQHSDSSMGHLLDEQQALGITSTNYGPDVDPGLIRKKLPDAEIQGQLPPFLLRNGAPDEIRARVLSDFQKAGASGRLVIATAGSLAAGTGVGRMRWLMQVVQEDCRYDRA